MCVCVCNILQMSMKGSKAEAKRSLREMSEEEEEDTFEEEEDEEEALEKKQKGKATSSSSSSAGACQVERCTADMSRAKQYHRRHKVCEFHAKAPVVRIYGLHQRFCQQCSRYLLCHQIYLSPVIKNKKKIRILTLVCIGFTSLVSLMNPNGVVGDA